MNALILILMTLGANAYDETFQKANTAYNGGDYAAAISMYEQLASEGVARPEVFYNLGNAYYRAKRLGPAIANFERALQLDPRFENARHNLDKAVKDTQRHLARPLPSEWEQGLLFWHYNLGRGTTYFLAGLSWLIFWALLTVRQWRSLPHTRWIAATMCLLAFAFGASAWTKAHPEALAAANDAKTPVHYGTDENETVRFELFAGDRVTVDKRIGGWARVETVDGERGWAKESSLTFVGPPYERPADPAPAPSAQPPAPAPPPPGKPVS